MHPTYPHLPDRLSPSGMTLLEVLISCGVLVVGLASIASILPAAGSRLGQATTEDRAGVLAANARTDGLARGLVSFDLFTVPAKSIAFGKGMATLPAISGAQFAAPSATLLAQRIDLQRGFLLEDEVVYAAPTTAQTPSNEFENGRRSFKEGVCWGATIVPQAFPAQAGTVAVLSVAVFKKEGLTEAVPLTQVDGGLYRMTTFDEGKLKKFLKSCSYVLVPAATATQGPRWFRITASWPAGGNGFVAFADPLFGTFAGPSPQAIGFENLIRVDQHNVVLE
jgi:hypothetical protein